MKKSPKTALTILEIIIVLVITIIVVSGGVFGFLAIRRIQVIEQSALNFKDNLENAKHSALVTKRSAGENWVYGIVVDISKLKTQGTYSVLKMCSPSGGYTPLTTAKINLFSWQDIGGAYCTGSSEGYVFLEGKKDLLVSSSLELISSSVDVNYIIFESVTGRVYFVGSTGSVLSTTSVIVNFESGKFSRKIKVTQGASIEFTDETFSADTNTEPVDQDPVPPPPPPPTIPGASQ